MHGEIITVGNELISGRTPDLNAWYAAGRLTASGLRVTRITSVGDDHRMLAEALTRSLADSRFVIITGGLGSTEDDITNEIAARALDRPLCLDRDMFDKIRNHAFAHSIEMTPSLEKMAWMPRGARMLNPLGASCGFVILEQKTPLYFLPGVPDQMRYLMDKVVLPELLDLYRTLPVVRQRVMKIFGLSEPGIAEVFRALRERESDMVFGFYPHFPENHITLSLRGQSESDVLAKLDQVESDIAGRLGACHFASGDRTMAEVVGQLLAERKLTLAVAESCSGGLIAHLLTGVPGSSAYFLGGVTAYSNPSKTALLGVRPESLTRHGAVSESVAGEMAGGVRDRLKTDLGVAVTGIAGPGGGSREKPVGTVHVALADRDRVLTGKYRFWGDRRQIKLHTAVMALDWIRRHLRGDPFLPGL